MEDGVCCCRRCVRAGHRVDCEDDASIITSYIKAEEEEEGVAAAVIDNDDDDDDDDDDDTDLLSLLKNGCKLLIMKMESNVLTNSAPQPQ